MFISLNPSYYCNFRCSFCYLGPALGDRAQITPEQLRQRLQEIVAYRAIDGIDIYGGEIGLLKPGYFEELSKVISEFYAGTIKVTSNLSVVPDFLKSNAVSLYVSFDGDVREKHELVLKNMRALERPFGLLMLSTKGLIEHNPEDFIALFNSIPNLRDVEIKPYSANQYNQQKLSWSEQEAWVKRWITSPTKKNFVLLNELSLQESISGSYNAYSDEHLYITPTGGFAVLDFDAEDREYFRPVSSISDYQNWCFEEKHTVAINTYCSKCEFLGHCLSEHLREVKSLDQSCNGGFHLLQWYKDRGLHAAF